MPARKVSDGESLTRTHLPIADLVPNPRNDRVHPRGQLDRLIASVKKFGQPRPILVRAQNKMIIAGHGVHQAMFEAGASEIEVVLWDVDQETADQYMVADNRLPELSYSDDDRRRALLEGLNGADLAALGFSQAEVDQLLNHEAEEIRVVEIHTDQVADDFWISVRGPLPLQAQALQRLNEVMGELGPEIIVELGTIPG